MIRRTSPSSKSQVSIAYQLCPAKTFLNSQGDITPGRTVLNHCEIVGEVAREMIARIPESIRKRLFPIGAPLVAASHDIGKVSPCFVEKIRSACTVNQNNIPSQPGVDPNLERSWGGHAGVSQVTAKALNVPKYVPEILGQHHGFSPPVDGKRADDEVFGGEVWQQERIALVAELKMRLAMDWPNVESVPQARLLAGLTSVADWIGSGEFFENPETPWRDNVGRALDAAGFVFPIFKQNLTFEAIFNFSPRSAQQQLIDQVVSPGVYVLEAPMGLGKTEAALYAAYRMLASGQATGIYFALPTQLTSNKIFTRFNQFLEKILEEDCHLRSLLLHGNAWLLDTDMGEEGKPGGAWFNHAKRGLLAPFAVGTIDQALMAAMHVKHGFVRAFGLAGKVVILDEVHTYDAYTGTLLDALVDLLRSLRCTVIILSATLNLERRQQMLGHELNCDAYPLITALPDSKPVSEHAVPVATSQQVAIKILADESLAVAEVLRRAEEGQQVLWIENTVVDAQNRFLDFAARAQAMGVACGLLHSRFTPENRQSIEDKWVNQFGKAGWSSRNTQGRILIGTQVLEQSLDIDADFMVSRFAPTDMLLQRLGRLWRHDDAPRSATANREAWFLAPVLESSISCPENAFGKSAFVYSPFVLCRSLEVWQHVQLVQLPMDIRSMIENTYKTRNESPDMARLLRDLDEGTRWRQGRKTMRQLARITLAETGNTFPESKAQTRYSETDSYEVLLLKKLTYIDEKRASKLTLLNGDECLLPCGRNALSKREWRQLTGKLMKQVVSVRVQDAPKSVDVETLKKYGFHNCFYLGNQDWKEDESVFRVALVDELGQLIGIHGVPVHDKCLLSYREDIGYQVLKT